MYMVETEFLFGLRTSDKWHEQVMKILSLFREGKIEALRSCTSAFLEVGIVLQAHGIRAEQIEDILFLMKQKFIEFNVGEAELNSDDILRLYELLRAYDVEFFDAMQAAVALGRNAILVTNDKIFTMLGVKTISFNELIRNTTEEREPRTSHSQKNQPKTTE